MARSLPRVFDLCSWNDFHQYWKRWSRYYVLSCPFLALLGSLFYTLEGCIPLFDVSNHERGAVQAEVSSSVLPEGAVEPRRAENAWDLF
jgi:hypothetical protein